MSGWIKIHREISNHWIFNDAERLKAWMIILIEVNHADSKFLIGDKLFDCARGESLKSLDTWAKLFGKNWNKSKVRRFFKLLESDSMIVLKSERKTTRLTVCNYADYQDVRNADETQVKHKRNTNETQVTPNKNVKKNKNDNISTTGEIKDYTQEREILRQVFNLFDKKYYDTDKKKEVWLEEIRKLREIDKHPSNLIIDVIKFGREDHFWSSNFLSISALRKKTDGVSKFDKILAKYNSQTNHHNEQQPKPKKERNYDESF